MNFRKPYNNELESLNLLIKKSKAFWGYTEKFCQEFMKNWSINQDYFNDAKISVLVNDDSPIGVIGMSLKDTLPMLDYFFLEPELIGKGLGRKLWDHTLKISTENNWSFFQFYSDPNAEAIYKHFGAKKIGEFESFPGRFVPIMEYVI